MYFKDIIGQDKIKSRLIHCVQENKIPHALLLAGPEGVGKLGLAIAFARYLCCTDRGEHDACGKCPSCQKFNKLAHPDLHFTFPIYKASPDSVCDHFMKTWRTQIQSDVYFNFHQWMDVIGAGNTQGQIYEKESGEILRKLSLKSYESDYKVMIIWLPEKMNQNCSNKLLKIIEEPPQNTIFILVCENTDQLIGTIYSRSQLMQVKRIALPDLQDATRKHYPQLSENQALSFARLSEGSWIKLRNLISSSQESQFMLDQFVRCMRGAYTIANFSPAKKVEKQNSLIDLKLWSEEMAKIGREKQKQFCTYAQNLIRENYIMNLREPQLNYLEPSQEVFSSKFFPFINDKNIESFMAEFELAEKHIEQNVNARMVFFDLALKAILLFKK
ncbi:MAG: DNA polymerase III subunit delta [Bacteroidales bacterium]|nr:DNA polymerase III subunit delta [Bacteroidales bacterium]